jgi:phospholipid transport system substrate-binding protein
MTPQRLFILAAVFVWTFAALLPSSAHATSTGAETSVAHFVQKMGDEALLKLTDKKLPRSTREARAREILHANFDIPTIARFSLGAYWKDATDAEKKEYINLFEDMIVQTYTTRFEDYSGQSFKVDGARPENDRDFIVSSHILQNGGPPIDIEWRVRKKGDQMKVVDVVIENISMSLTQRSDFSSVIQRGGGNFEALLESLRARKISAAKIK